MSSDQPIEILDEDEPKMAHSAAKADEGTAIRTFLEFSGNSDRSFAVKMLSECNYDVQRALSKVTFPTKDRGDTSSSNTISLSDPSPSGQVAVNDDEVVDEGKPSAVPLTESSQREEEPVKSTMWYSCMARSPDRFVDPDFPPDQSSLDGRKQTITAATGVSDIIKCVCGLPVTPKSVQSDGPNYGRFYLCCGKARQRRAQQCKFFQWDDRNGSKGAGYATRYSLMAWEYFGDKPGHTLVKNNEFGPDAVRQGAVGNCWFLSALAVVAEKSYLVRQLLPHRALNKKGCYQVNLCLDGKWTPIIIDSHFPVVYGGRIVDPLRGGTTPSTDSLSIHPAFCAIPDGQLWSALIEKAYAKAHGSYQQLSGGFIQEGFSDMTGAPTETLLFDGNIWDFEDLWARLLSFHEAGFLMGVATSRGGEGLVGGHAYSVLDVIELNDYLVGEQQSMRDFLAGSPTKKKQRTTIRLICIRNPWGKKEWKGEWSADSEQWTRALRKRLGKRTYSKGDGTFFMSYQDMLRRFHHMDIAMCRQGWKHSSCDGFFLSGTQDPLKSTKVCYQLAVSKRTFCYVQIIQPKKRANTGSQYWYHDPSIIVLKRKHGSEEWSNEKIALCGMVRSATLEVFLDPLYEYEVVPFSLKSDRSAPFRLTSYSAEEVQIFPVSKRVENESILTQLHRHLLMNDRKLQYVIAPSAVLVCVHENRCLFFVAINASHDHMASLRLSLKLQKGLWLSFGTSGEVFDVPCRSQRILLAVSSDGTLSSAIGVDLNWASEIVPVATRRSCKFGSNSGLGSAIDIGVLGDLVAGESLDVKSLVMNNCYKGSDTIETFQWFSQIGLCPS